MAGGASYGHDQSAGTLAYNTGKEGEMIAHKDSTVAKKLAYVAKYGVDCTAGRKLATSYTALRRERNELQLTFASLRKLQTKT